MRSTNVLVPLVIVPLVLVLLAAILLACVLGLRGPALHVPTRSLASADGVRHVG